MRTHALIVVLVIVALVAAVNAGFQLSGALRQVDALAGAATVEAVHPVAVPPPAQSRPSPLPAPLAPRPAPVDEEPSPREPVARFDADAALREAGDRDQNVAELLNASDPAVGAAVRDFITQLEPPGGR